MHGLFDRTGILHDTTVVTVNGYGVIAMFAIVTMTTIVAMKGFISCHYHTRQDPRTPRFAQRTSPLDLELSGRLRRLTQRAVRTTPGDPADARLTGQV